MSINLDLQLVSSQVVRSNFVPFSVFPICRLVFCPTMDRRCISVESLGACSCVNPETFTQHLFQLKTVNYFYFQEAKSNLKAKPMVKSVSGSNIPVKLDTGKLACNCKI